MAFERMRACRGLPANFALLPLLAWMGTAHLNAPVVEQEQDSDAYLIYSRLLREEMPSHWKGKPWLIKRKTEWSILEMCLEPPLSQWWTYQPLIDAFKRRNEHRLLLQRRFDLPEYALVNLEFPTAEGEMLFNVSAVAFNKKHTRALVYIAHQCGSLCGGGAYHFMIKKNGEWEGDTGFQGTGCTWVS